MPLSLLAAVVLILPARGAQADEPALETTVSAPSEPEPGLLSEERGGSTVTRRELQVRLPRSAPDALRYEPGVFVQQSAHGQGSAYLRGMTGQQTLMLFDGIRLNNATFRQGPNQYFFTLDARTLQSIEVQRGGASTRWGSDALGGALLARPLEPSAPGSSPGVHLEPRVSLRGTTADEEYGGRAQLDASARLAGGLGLAFLAGAGVRRVGLLHGPPVLNPDPDTSAGPLPWVPRYDEYVPTLPLSQQPRLRTQHGTGFNELTADGRLVAQLPRGGSLTAAAYLYQQYDAPRTDQCPAPTAPFDECLTYEEQFRHLAYLAWRGSAGALADDARVTVSWQQQHERRRLDQTSANKVSRGVDDVDTLGATARATVKLPVPSLSLAWGAEHYVDLLRSRAWHTYTDTQQSVDLSRGQYLDGSSYQTGGVYVDGRWQLHPAVTARAGGRLAWVVARAFADPQSGSAAVDRAWVPWVGHAGLEWAPAGAWRLFLNADRSFRAPNLDDLTSRQQTGPGFQFENAALQPELAHSVELGGRLRQAWLSADAWLFATRLDGAMLRVVKTSGECPPATPQCLAAWSRLQLQNAPSPAALRGAEGAVRAQLPLRLTARASLSWVWSDGPRVGDVGYGVSAVVTGDRVPLSKTPPLSGTAELGWSHPAGFSASAATQWAAPQERLALADYSDGRIPRYGTPGFAVFHLRVGWRLDTRLAVSAVLENVLDAPYRFHGSSVNGAGRGVVLQLDAGQLLF